MLIKLQENHPFDIGRITIFFANRNFEENSATGFTIPTLTEPEKYVCWMINMDTDLPEACAVLNSGVSSTYYYITISASGGFITVF